MTNTNTETYTNFYDCKDDPLFEDFIVERNLKPTSEDSYRHALNSYCQFHKMTLSELIDEADLEEEEMVRMKNRKLRKRLLNYRTSQIQEAVLSQTTVLDYLGKVRSFYIHQLIEIPPLPPIQTKKKQVTIDDLPSKKDIITLLKHTNSLKHQAIIVFLASSGLARLETCNLKVQDFIDATREYHNYNDIQDVIRILETKDNIVPLFKITRRKNQYTHYSAITPECVSYILRYLKTRKNLKNNDLLFDIQPRVLNVYLKRLNDKAKFPTINGKALFHPHNLRRYHATTIKDKNLANMLQGRKSDPITEAYFKQDPKHIKQEYTKHIEALTLQPSKVITIESDEVKQLKQQHRKEIAQLQADFDRRFQTVEKLIQEYIQQQK